MFIFTRPEDDVIFEMSEDCTTQEGTGYPLIHNGTIAIGCPYQKYEVAEVPSNVVAEKYIYTKAGGFVKNPNYKRYYSNEERIQALEDMVNELIMEM